RGGVGPLKVAVLAEAKLMIGAVEIRLRACGLSTPKRRKTPSSPPKPGESVTPERLKASSNEFAGVVPTGSGPRKGHGLVSDANKTGTSSRRTSSRWREVAETLSFGGFFRARNTARAVTIM